MSRMVITAQGKQFSFDLAELSEGPLSARGKMMLRPVEAMGVNGREYQEVGLRTDPITITTTLSTNDYNRDESRALALVGEEVRIRYESPTGTRVWNEAVIVDAVTLQRTGQLFGKGSRTTDRHTLIMQWVIDAVPEES